MRDQKAIRGLGMIWTPSWAAWRLRTILTGRAWTGTGHKNGLMIPSRGQDEAAGVAEGR